MAASPAFCTWCGARLEEGGHLACAGGGELDPPRHCGRCGGRLDVQIYPTGITATCRGCDGVHPARRPGRGPA